MLDPLTRTCHCYLLRKDFLFSPHFSGCLVFESWRILSTKLHLLHHKGQCKFASTERTSLSSTNDLRVKKFFPQLGMIQKLDKIIRVVLKANWNAFVGTRRSIQRAEKMLMAMNTFMKSTKIIENL